MRILVICFILFCSIITYAQEFSRKDSLRGNLTPVRTCYDVTFYDLFIIIDIPEKAIERSYNEIHFEAITDFNHFQIDMANNMDVMLIEFEEEELEFNREFDAVYIYFSRTIKKGEHSKIKVWYGGYPKEAINPPWDGGFSWKKDKNYACVSHGSKPNRHVFSVFSSK